MSQSVFSSISSSRSIRAPDWGDFNISGPTHLTSIDWENAAHHRAVASTLINALYVYLDDEQNRQHGTNARAPQWWSFFGFEPPELLTDTSDPDSNPCFGAVFRRSTASASNSGPAIVCAIRGLKTARDWDVSIKSWFSILETRTCFKVLMNALENYTNDESLRGRIWLCGHSLGATIATGAGQEMARRGISLTTFLFNPPYSLDPTTKNLFFVDLGKAILGMSTAASLFGPVGFVSAATFLAGFHTGKALVEYFERKKRADELYQKMTSWVPLMFLNREDLFCQEYIKYFENRRVKSRPHLPKRIASAVLVRNLDATASTFLKSHGIAQWWTKNLHVQAKLCLLGYKPRVLDRTRY